MPFGAGFHLLAVYFDEECCLQICSKKFGCHVVVSSCGVRPSAPQANQCEVHTPLLYKTFGGGGAGGSRMAIHFVIKSLYSLSFD